MYSSDLTEDKYFMIYIKTPTHDSENQFLDDFHWKLTYWGNACKIKICECEMCKTP